MEDLPEWRDLIKLNERVANLIEFVIFASEGRLIISFRLKSTGMIIGNVIVLSRRPETDCSYQFSLLLVNGDYIAEA